MCILLAPCVSRGTLTRSESFLPSILCYLSALRATLLPWTEPQLLLLLWAFTVTERWLWGRIFGWREWGFWRQRPHIGIRSFSASQEWLSCVLGEVLTDRCSVSFLPAGGPTGESLVTTAAVWGTWAGAAVNTTLNVVPLPLFLGWPQVTDFNSVRHHSKALLMQNHSLTLLKSSRVRRAQWP